MRNGERVHRQFIVHPSRFLPSLFLFPAKHSRKLLQVPGLLLGAASLPQQPPDLASFYAQYYIQYHVLIEKSAVLLR